MNEGMSMRLVNIRLNTPMRISNEKTSNYMINRKKKKKTEAQVSSSSYSLRKNSLVSISMQKKLNLSVNGSNAGIGHQKSNIKLLTIIPKVANSSSFEKQTSKKISINNNNYNYNMSSLEKNKRLSNTLFNNVAHNKRLEKLKEVKVKLSLKRIAVIMEKSYFFKFWNEIERSMLAVRDNLPGDLISLLCSDVLLEIFSFFNRRDVLDSLQFVCKEFYVYANSNMIWRGFFVKKFGYCNKNVLESAGSLSSLNFTPFFWKRFYFKHFNAFVKRRWKKKDYTKVFFEDFLIHLKKINSKIPQEQSKEYFNLIDFDVKGYIYMFELEKFIINSGIFR